MFRLETHARTRRVALAVLLPLTVWLSAGCQAEPRRPADAPATEIRPIDVYPEAVEVRLSVQSADEAVQRQYDERGPRTLTTDERRRVEAAFHEVTVWRSDSIATANACFIPHHFLTYYDASGRQVGRLSVCFCCHGVRDEPNVVDFRPSAGAVWRYLDFDRETLGTAIRALGFPTDVDCFTPEPVST